MCCTKSFCLLNDFTQPSWPQTNGLAVIGLDLLGHRPVQNRAGAAWRKERGGCLGPEKKGKIESSTEVDEKESNEEAN